MRKIFSAFILLSPVLWGQWIPLPQLPPIDDFIIDTLYVNMPHDSLDSDLHTGLQVQDTRDLDTTILDIRQTDKYKLIPVDQYIALDRPLAELFTDRFAQDCVDFKGTLKISRLSIWYDSSPAFAKGFRLNAYTILYNENKDPLSDWIWEISVDKVHKEKEADQLGRMVAKWLDLQSKAIQSRAFNRNLYPYLFRRQLMVWTEYILFPDGFALNGHLTLDYPPDQQRKWVRGSPGIYYRKAAHHESIAIGGLDQQWYRRIRTPWVLRFSTTGRFGFNHFDKEYYSYLDYWNIVFLNLASSVSLDYRPVYHKGVYGGVGFFNSFNILPLVIDRYEFGISFSVGVILP